MVFVNQAYAKMGTSEKQVVQAMKIVEQMETVIWTKKKIPVFVFPTLTVIMM